MAHHQDVVIVGKDKGDIPKDRIHEPLKGLGRIPQPEWHLDELEQSEGSGDGRLADMVRVYRDLVICLSKVNFGKACSSLQICGKVGYEGKRVEVIL